MLTLNAEATMESMGFYGGEHTDSHDAVGYFSNMTTNSDVPEDYDPGCFFILELGVFIGLTRYASINFSGLRRHGGSPPTAPRGKKVLLYCYRVVFISYPPNNMTNGNARYSLGAVPNGKEGTETFIFSPEMTKVG